MVFKNNDLLYRF